MGDAAGGNVRSSLGAGSIVVSLAPKFTFVKLTGLLGGFARLARVIPNAPSVVGAGFNPVRLRLRCAPATRRRSSDLLVTLGECPEVAEEKLEAYAVLLAMGPTYFWFQLQALRKWRRGSG